MRRCPDHKIGQKTIQEYHEKTKNIDVKLGNNLQNAELNIEMNVIYVVVPIDAGSTALADSQIQQMHKELNLRFQGKGVSKVPNTTKYPYTAAFTTPYFIFEPKDYTQLSVANGQIIRLNAPSPLPTSYSDVTKLKAEFLKQGHSFINGYMYAFISTMTANGNPLLGIAEDIISNVCAVDYRSVGSETSPGIYGAAFGQGATLVHEFGHCFGLYHIFSGDNSCTSAYSNFINSLRPECPRQKNSNSYADLAFVSTNAKDNRGRDKLRFVDSNTDGINPGGTASDPAYSCATIAELTAGTVPYEPFFSIMDYGDDNTMLAFSISSVSLMRSVVLNNPSKFKVNNLTDFGIVATSSSSSSFPVWAIILISVVAGLIVIGLIVWAAMKGKNGGVRNFKRSQFYGVQGLSNFK